MILIPAIDIQDGRCVRLRQGDMNDQTVYGDDPVAVADRWVAAGARRLHIVDLDGAKAGKPLAAAIVRKIVDNHPDLPIQIGGGIRTRQTVAAYLEAGVRWTIIGTQAVKDPDFIRDLCAQFASHIIVSLDTKDRRIATDGWSELLAHDMIDLAQRFERHGVDAIVHTDIARDGMMTGVNVDATAELANAIGIPVIASGGITDLDDIRRLHAADSPGIRAAITGRAIYEGALDFAAGQALADRLWANVQPGRASSP